MNNLFEEAALPRLESAISVMKERGSQYADTLRICPFTWSINVAKELGVTLLPEVARAIAMAAMVDLKYSRMAGGYKLDNIEDAINYAATIPHMIELAKEAINQPFLGEVSGFTQQGISAPDRFNK